MDTFNNLDIGDSIEIDNLLNGKEIKKENDSSTDPSTLK